jgi:uncharacterized protein (TIGR03437 family)
MLPRRLLLALAGAAMLQAQAPTAPVISARGVTNFFTQEPAPGTVALGGLVQISGLNLGPPEGATAAGTPWPTRLADVQVVVGGRLAPLYSVSPGAILAQVPPNANMGLVDVVVRRPSGNSAPAHVIVNALVPAVRTVKDRGYGAPWGMVTAQTIVTTADGLGATDVAIAPGDVGPSDTPAIPKAPISAYVGGLRATVSATASTQRPGEFDVSITVPSGARSGDLITLAANRQAANLTQFQPMAASDVQFVPLPARAPTIANLIDTGVNGNFLVATSARGSDGCYSAITVNMAAKSLAVAPDCFTSVAAAIPAAVAPNQSDAIGALMGPPQGDAQSGISSTVKIYSAAGDPLTVTLPAAASTLTTTPTGFVAAIPGTPAQLATIDAVTGAVQIAPAGQGAGGAGAGAAPGGATPTINVNGLTHVYASAGIGQNRTAVIAGDDALKPTKAAFAVLSAAGDVVIFQDFPGGYLPLLNAVAPARPGQAAPAVPPREPALYDAAARVFFVLARATDASKDAFMAFSATADPKIAAFPAGWFAASCTADIRLLSLGLVNQLAVAGSKVAEPEYKSACPGAGFLTLDLAQSSVTAIPLPDAGSLRVPSTRADTSLSQMNNYVFGVRLDPTRAATSDTVYVLDGVNGNAFILPVPSTVNGFTDASVQQIPELNSLLAQTIDRLAGDQGLILFNLDEQKTTNLPVPDGFTTVANLDDGATACCLVTRKLAGRALKQGGSSVAIYDLITGDVTVAPNPEGITSVGFPPAANPGGNAAPAGSLIFANARANTISAVAYNGNRQAGIIVVRVP